MFIEYVTQHVPEETVRMILMFPVIATLIAFIRQVIGIKAFGIYTPSLVTFAFLAMGESGAKYGIAIFVSVIAVGLVTRFILKQFRLLYLPRVALNLSIVAFSILALLVLGGNYQRTGLASVSIFPILIMISIVEKFVTAQIKGGSKAAIILAVETLGISLVGYYIASWSVLEKLIMTYPWVIFIVLSFNIFLGKWTGLRLGEYFRFKGILKKVN
jgi:hypothetical protein